MIFFFIKSVRKKMMPIFRITLHLIISIQLCLLPSLSYASSPSETIVEQQNKIFDHFKNLENLENSEIKLNEIDYYSVAAQSVDGIENIYTKTGRLKAIPSFTRQFGDDQGSNDEHKPIPQANEVQFSYDDENKEIVIKGMAKGVLVLRQRIPGFDVVSYTQDGDFIIFLTEDGRLFLIDQIFATMFIGHSPIPVTRILVPPIDPELIGSGSLSLEFIKDGLPGVQALESLDTAINTEGTPILTLGDLAVIFEKNNSKELVQALPRKELKAWNLHTIYAINAMIQNEHFAALENTDLTDLTKDVESKLKDQKYLLYQFLKKLGDNVNIEGFSRRSSDLQALLKVRLEDTPPRGQHLLESTLEGDEKKKTSEDKAFVDTVKKLASGLSSFITKRPVVTTLAGVGAVAAAAAWPILLNISLFNVANHMTEIYSGFDYSYSSTPGLITTLLLLPLIAITAVESGMGLIHLANKLSNKFNINSWNIKGRTASFISQWGNEDIEKKWRRGMAKRMVGLGMQFVAYTMNPFWKAIPVILRQKNFKKGVLADAPFSLLFNWPLFDKKRIEAKSKKIDEIEKRQFAQGATALVLAAAVVSNGENGLDIAEQVLIEHSIEASRTLGQKIFNPPDTPDTKSSGLKRVTMLWIIDQLRKEMAQGNHDLSHIDLESLKKWFDRAQDIYRKTSSVRTRNVLKMKNSDLYKLIPLFDFFKLKNLLTLKDKEVAILLQAPTPFVSERTVMEFLADQFMMSLIPLLFTERAHLGTLGSGHAIAVGEGAVWAGTQHRNDALANLVMHFFVAGSYRSLVFSKLIEKLEDLKKQAQEPYKLEESEVDRQQSAFEYWERNIFGVFNSRLKKKNLGEIMPKMFFGRLSTVQTYIALIFGLRYSLSNQSAEEAILGFTFFFFAAVWMYAWPWDVIATGAFLNKGQLAENKALVEEIVQPLTRLEDKTYTAKELKLLPEEIKSKIEELFSKRPAVLDGFYKENHIDDLSSWLQKNPRESAGNLLKFLNKDLPINTQKNNRADWIWTTIFGGVLSTILAVYLIVWTFDPAFLTAQTITGVIAAHFGALAFMRALYAPEEFPKLERMLSELQEKIQEKKEITPKDIRKLMRAVDRIYLNTPFEGQWLELKERFAIDGLLDIERAPDFVPKVQELFSKEKPDAKGLVQHTTETFLPAGACRKIFGKRK